MPVKRYDRTTNTFYTIKPKLVHIGNVKSKKINDIKNIAPSDKYRIADLVNKVEHFGTEFGAKTILSLSNCDIFKIRDEVESDKSKVNQMNIKKEKFKKTNSIDLIRKQLGIK